MLCYFVAFDVNIDPVVSDTAVMMVVVITASCDNDCDRMFVCVCVQVCPKDCLVCSLLSGKPWCNPNGCNTTHAYNSDDGSCVGE